MRGEASGYEAEEQARRGWISRAWVGLRGVGDEWDAHAGGMAMPSYHGLL